MMMMTWRASALSFLKYVSVDDDDDDGDDDGGRRHMHELTCYTHTLSLSHTQTHKHTNTQTHKHTNTHTHTHTHTYLGTCDMLTPATGCLCVLQVAQRQPFERLDPILDRINESIDTTVSRGKCASSRERFCCYMYVCVAARALTWSSKEACSELRNLAYTD